MAKITHCTLTKHWVSKLRPGLPNYAMANLTYKNLVAVNAPTFSEGAKLFAREIQKNLKLEPMEDLFVKECSQLISPREAGAKMRESLPPTVMNFTSDDYVEYTWHAPTARFYIGRPMLISPEAGYQYPAWVMNALGGHRDCIDPMIFCASRTIATTLVDLLTKPEELQKAQEEFIERTGGGIGGSKWRAPLLPPDIRPPINFPWPEYINTARGEEWWIPTSEED